MKFSGFSVLLVIGLFAAVVGCGGGGAGGSSGNPVPGIYEAAYSRGGGAIVINIPSTGQATAILSDESGGIFTGPVTDTSFQGVITVSGTLTSATNPGSTIALDATATIIGSVVTINGQLAGAFSVSFTAQEAGTANNLTVSTVAGDYTGSYVTSQGGQQVDQGTLTASVSTTGVFTGGNSTNTFNAKLGNGGGYVGTTTFPDLTSTAPIYGVVTVVSAGNLSVSYTIPGSSPSTTQTGTITLSKVSTANPFIGNFVGSSLFPSSPAGISSVTLGVTTNGTATGTLTDPQISSNQATFTGSITSAGVFTAVETAGSQTHQLHGTLMVNSAHEVVGQVFSDSSQTGSFVTLSKVNAALQFAGHFTGNISGFQTGTADITIGSTGIVSGTETLTGGSPLTLSGSVSVLGQATIGVQGGGTSSGGAAFDGSGHLVIVIGNATATETISLINA